MSLYSSDTLSSVGEDNQVEANHGSVSEREILSVYDNESPWFYLFTHCSKMEQVERKLQEKFQTFIHKTVVYSRHKKCIMKEERPTISGLIFVKGECCHEIQAFLDRYLPGLHLVKDYYTRKIVTIPSSQMFPFMKISEIGADKVRFMPNSLGHYAFGHTRIVVTSGLLAGLEGYIIRIAREKRLVTSIGNMTIAISGINKESFENAEEYVNLRKEQQGEKVFPNTATFTPEQIRVNNCFFEPQNRIDVLAIAKSLDKCILQAESLIMSHEYVKAIEIAVCILEEIGCRMFHDGKQMRVDRIKDVINAMCNNTIRILSTIETLPGISAEIKERIDTERQSLFIRFPFLPLSDK